MSGREPSAEEQASLQALRKRLIDMQVVKALFHIFSKIFSIENVVF